MRIKSLKTYNSIFADWIQMPEANRVDANNIMYINFPEVTKNVFL